MGRLRHGRPDQALALLRDSADREGRTEKHPVTPGRSFRRASSSRRCCWGSWTPADARREYEAVQRTEPRRFRNYLGSARAAEMAGDRAKATAYYRKLVTLAKDGDATRPELANAKKLAQL